MLGNARHDNGQRDCSGCARQGRTWRSTGQAAAATFAWYCLLASVPCRGQQTGDEGLHAHSGHDAIAGTPERESLQQLSLVDVEATLYSRAKQDFQGDQEAFQDAVRFTRAHAQSASALAPAAPHLACVRYGAGRAFSSAAAAAGLPHDVVSNDETAGSACLLLHCTADSLEALLATERCRGWACRGGALPANLKISPALLHFASDQHDGATHLRHTQNFKRPDRPPGHLEHRGLRLNMQAGAPARRRRRKGGGGGARGAIGLKVTMARGSPLASADADAAAAAYGALLQEWRREWGALTSRGAIRGLSWHSEGGAHAAAQRQRPGRTPEAREHADTITELMDHVADLVSQAAGGPRSAADVCGWHALPLVHARADGSVHVGAAHALRGGGSSGGGGTMRDVACTYALLAFLARRSEVAHITPLHALAHRNDVAQAVVQSGARDGAAHGAKPLWSAGLRGHGQVIGVSDTGLDDASCFFRDDARGRTPRGLWPQDVGVTYPEQRKVIQYLHTNVTDIYDAYRGHGTHVAGSAVGAVAPSAAAADAGELLGTCPAPATRLCTGECLSDADCAAVGLLSPCARNARDALFNRYFNCPRLGCDGNFTAVLSSWYDAPPCGEDARALVPRAGGAAPAAKLAFFDLGRSDYFTDERVSFAEVLDALLRAGAKVSAAAAAAAAAAVAAGRVMTARWRFLSCSRAPRTTIVYGLDAEASCTSASVVGGAGRTWCAAPPPPCARLTPTNSHAEAEPNCSGPHPVACAHCRWCCRASARLCSHQPSPLPPARR
ncbi:hypothetical protein JKP88DRAFT_157122 [Tribonema minus]|uniref:subtilisin n=1 Tax=Tribonema minus TaxID=303371 RepID=A0A836CIB0_9STRA|nr:hypothetical protein JKP88DRAFT_157122 [Tribonema minus]